MVNQSLSESLQSPTHIECSLVFLPKKSEPIHFLRAIRSCISFPFINFSCVDSFFFDQSSKHLSADHLRYEHGHSYMATSVGLVSYILADQGQRDELPTKQTSFLVQPYVGLAKIVL